MDAVMRAYQDGIHQIVSELFTTMLATEVSPASHYRPPGKDHITALIPFAGSWMGVMEFECGATEAVNFAQRFLQTAEFQECNEDVRDTIGELTNIIAGNLKALMPSEVKIGTPSIIGGADYSVHTSGGALMGQNSFCTDVGIFSVRLIEGKSLSRGTQ